MTRHSSKPNKMRYVKPRMMEHEEYPHLRMENLQYQNQIHRFYHKFWTKPSEIVKCKSRNGASYRMNLLYLAEVLMGVNLIDHTVKIGNINV